MEKGNTMTNHTDILKASVTMLGDRGRRYGSVEETFDRAAKLSTILLDKQITMYDIAIIFHAMKMARLNSSRTLDDNYVDGINYLAFAAQFSQAEEQVKVALEEDIAAMARKFAPVRQPMPTPQTVPTIMPTPEPKSE
jgi:hypothetical protein